MKLYDKDRIFKIVFIVFVIRVLFLIIVPPYIGIANNGDFQRLMLPVGLDYVDDPWLPENYGDSFFNYVTNNFHYVAVQDTGWHQIFEIFPLIAIGLSNKIPDGGIFDIRYLGVVNAAVYLFAAYVLIKLVKKIDGYLSYVLLFMSLLILGDAYVIQFFNSFYTEIGSVSAILLLWGMLIYSFLFVAKQKKSKKIMFVILDSVVAIFAILSKKQDVLIIVPIILIMILLLKRFEATLIHKAIWVIVFCGLAVFLFSNNSGAENRTFANVILKDILSNSDAPSEHLNRIGFSEDEIDIVMTAVGETIFTEAGSNVWSKFADKFTISNEIKIISREPKIVVRMMFKRSSSLFADDEGLGNYMKESGASPKEKTDENRAWSHIKSHIYISSFPFYCIIVSLALILVAVGINSKYLNFIPKDLFWIYLVLPISNILRFITVILGDSSHDDCKHFFSLNFEFDFIFIVNILILLLLIKNTIKKSSQHNINILK